VTTAATPVVNHSSTMPQYVPGMYETQILAARALRELLDRPDCNDCKELLASVRVLQNAIATGKPVTRKDCAGVAKYLRRLGWNAAAISAATAAWPSRSRRRRA
jgi:hypothetical protein